MRIRLRKRKAKRQLKKKYRNRLTLLLSVLLIVGLVSSIKRVASSEIRNNPMITIESSDTSEKETVKEVVKKVEVVEKELDYKENLITESGKSLLTNMEALNTTYLNQVSFMLLNRETGETVAYNEDKVYTSASLYKLYVTYAVLNKVDKDELTLDTPMDAVGGTVDSYITKTITLSANETARALAELVTWDYVEEFIHANGFTNTTFNLYQSGGVTYTGTLQTNASDVTKIINKLYDKELLSETSTEYFINQLNNQQLTYALNRGLTDEVAFAHKTGILDDVSHDAGVITYNDKEYVVTVMSDGWSSATSEAGPIFDSVGSYIMEYLYNNKGE